MNGSALLVAILMGITGSLHCAGMCGAIMWIMPFQLFRGHRKIAAIAFYHFARVSMYAIMALVLYTFKGLFDPHIQQFISIVMGCVLLIAGILSFLPGKAVKMNVPWAGYFQKRLGAFIGQPDLVKITIAGGLNGLLPCGLVYMALSATLSLSTSLSAVGFMYAFGLGTLPMLIAITLLKSKIRSNVSHISKFVPIAIFSFGCLFLLRGLNLGIPYLSPKVEVVDHQIHSCCHKK